MQVYLEAWKYARSVLTDVGKSEAGPLLPAVKQLVENWTNPEFEKFVDDIADLVNRSVPSCLARFLNQ